jgi:hypothetical protein
MCKSPRNAGLQGERDGGDGLARAALEAGGMQLACRGQLVVVSGKRF